MKGGNPAFQNVLSKTEVVDAGHQIASNIKALD